jgi:hypothetical protein
VLRLEVSAPAKGSPLNGSVPKASTIAKGTPASQSLVDAREG